VFGGVGFLGNDDVEEALPSCCSLLTVCRVVSYDCFRGVRVLYGKVR
jgi:hypothetical protein